MTNLLTARELYKFLISDYKIKNLIGSIKFQLGNIDIGVGRRDVMGDVIQDWLCELLRRFQIDFIANPMPQTPPDIFLNPEDLQSNWLEIKAFNRSDNPRFSIAVFDFFVEDCIEQPWHLDTDYLIFGYNLDKETGILRIKDLWLKKIWEITKPMLHWPLTVKTSCGVPREIRPCTWYAAKTNTKVFESLEDFLSALEAAIIQNPEKSYKGSHWRKKFLKSYFKHYGYEIEIPKWEDIKYKYKIFTS